MYFLPQTNKPIAFLDNQSATPEGLLAVGGNLHPLTIISAYSQGIFPWFSENDPILWWTPDPRLVIFPNSVHFSRGMSKILKKISLPSRPLSPEKKALAPYEISINLRFQEVIENCAKKRLPKRHETWITSEMLKAYCELHRMGWAHSIEVVNQKKELVGGLYGIAVGKIFFGESMFSHESNTSKLALGWLCDLLVQKKFILIDCQVESDHLKSLGAVTIPRKEFLMYLKKGKTNLNNKFLL